MRGRGSDRLGDAADQMSGEASPCGLASLGVFAQGAKLPEVVQVSGEASPCGLVSLGVFAQRAKLPEVVQ